MQAIIFEPTLYSIGVVDAFTSFLWTDRYYECGDFEIYAPYNKKDLDLMVLDNYVWIVDSDHMMIVESISIETDAENGNSMTVSGRSLESILDRRCIWGFKSFEEGSNLQNGIQTLLNENAISPSDSRRKIPNLIFKPSTDSRITSLTFEAQYFGENLYDAIVALCQEKKIGFQILPNFDTMKLEFSLYIGENRSYSQNALPYVVFSPKFDNITSSTYLESRKLRKNAVLIGGDGEGSEKRTASYISGSETGLARRETYVDANGLSTTDEENNPLPDSDIEEQMVQKGKETLAELDPEVIFEGEVEAQRQFVYGVDFKMGDIVQIVNEYGKEATSRVVEMMRSLDTDGLHAIPTFVAEK